MEAQARRSIQNALFLWGIAGCEVQNFQYLISEVSLRHACHYSRKKIRPSYDVRCLQPLHPLEMLSLAPHTAAKHFLQDPGVKEKGTHLQVEANRGIAQ
jgi:hypothetical protein